jgi:Pregnancy-associated plasma protein-A
MRRIFLFIAFCFLFQALAWGQKWLKAEKIQYRSAPMKEQKKDPLQKRLNLAWREPLDFVPDTARLEDTPVKWVRVNVHFMNSRSGQHNYRGDEAIRFAQDLVHTANGDLQKNNALWLPWQNRLPVIPPRYQYVLTPQKNRAGDTGVYFHDDDELCFYVHKGDYANLYDRRVFEKYGVQTDSIVNVFIMPHHPDSMRSEKYRRGSGGVGVMLSEGIKMAGMFESKMPAWAYRGILNHEVGHFFGLFHAFDNDGCDDTPEHDNSCWNRTTEAPCNTRASNNMMDYNALQNALSPCQIGRVLMLMNDTAAVERRYLIHNWCKRQSNMPDLLVNDTLRWRGERDLLGNLHLTKGAYLQIDGRVSLPEGASITLEPGATLLLRNGILHNSCGKKWLGIDAPRRFLGARGKVIVEGKGRIEDVLQWTINSGQ